MPSVTAQQAVSTAAAERAWALLADPAGLPARVRHVLDVTPTADGGERWTVLLNGSEVTWEQRTEWAPGELRFEQTTGDLDRLGGAWAVRDDRLVLHIDFTLGIDGLAPLLDPIWTQSFQAHADALVAAIGGGKADA